MIQIANQSAHTTADRRVWRRWEKTEKMIKPQMTKVIAERHIESTLSDGRSETLIVQVGQPERDPNPGGD